ncbi:MAG: HzsA-related protein [Planctomycetota bacterium]
MHARMLLTIVLASAAAAASAMAGDAPENLALKARVSATSEHSAGYRARFVADGIIPKATLRDGDGEEWAVNGNTHKGGADLTMEWPEPVTIGEIVYYGRTSLAVECWKACEVYLDDAATPAAKAEFKTGHGPQRVALAAPAQAAKLTLKFKCSPACQNPGASEIRVYSSPAPDAALGKFVPMKPMHGSFPGGGGGRAPAVSPVEESPELAAELYAGKLGFTRMILVQRHEFKISHVYTYHVESFRPGGGIYILTPVGEGRRLEKILDAGAGEVMDCILSCDGKEILFSWKKKNARGLNHMITDRDAKYQVYRMDLAERKPKLLTDHYSNNFNPCWLPDGGIAFLSDRKLSFAYCFTSSSPLLYRMDGDGANVRKISHGYLNDFTPSILNDGRIIYSRWEYVDRPAIPIQSLWTMKPDGTKLEGFFGNRVLEPGTFMEARSIGKTRKVLCVLTGHNGSCRGALGVIDPVYGANAQKGIRNITPEIRMGVTTRGDGNGLMNRGPYENPFPIDEKYFLVSNRGTVILRDYDGTAKVTLMGPKDGMGFYSPQPMRAVKRPPVIPSMLPEKAEPWATVIVRDVYNGLEPDVERGEIKRIAVVEEVEKGDYAPHKGIFGFQFPLVSCGATYAAKKLWGYARIEKDGSAGFKVPTGVPIYFLALDDKGRAVQRMRSFTHYQPGEYQSCVGCHANRNYAAPPSAGTRPVAALRAPQELDQPEWGQRKFGYSTIVQPVLDRYCIKCHNARKSPRGVDLTGDKTDFFCVSYDHLARKGTHGEKDPFRHSVRSLEGVGRNPYVRWISSINGSEQNILMIEPRTWGAYASKLADMILAGHPDAEGKKRYEMDEASVRRMMAWMDLNVPYYKDSKTNHPNTPGSRMLRPRDLDKVLEDVRKRRCAECHKKVPRKFYTRITNVEENNFLLAPLAEAAGGTGACEGEVFKSKDDPDYVAILKTFEPITKLMAERPRIDFPGAEYVPHKDAHPVVACETPAP